MPDPRAQLAAAQSHLVRSLVASASIPDGFDEAGLRATADTLARKRRRTIEKASPRLVQSLAYRFNELFALFAADHPLSDNDDADFALWLYRRRQLPRAGAIEFLTRRTHHGLPLRIMWMDRHPIIAMRLPFLGIRVLCA